MRRSDMQWGWMMRYYQERIVFESLYGCGDQQDIYRGDFFGLYIMGGEL